MGNHSTTRRNLLAGAAWVAALPAAASAVTSTGDVNAGAFCTKTGACPCADPCIWGRQAFDDLRRAGWPAVENSTAPDAELVRLCELFHKLHADVQTADSDATLKAAMVEREAASHQIQAMRPQTALGFQMKAAVGVVLLDENYGWPADGEPLDHDIAFAWATLRNVAESGRA